MKDLVSVVIPTKNSEKTLEKCLESIRSQSYRNLEIIVVDNSSTDNTKEIARKFTKLVFNKGPERSSQRNFGAKKSKGDYLLFIDSDMELEKDVIKECIEKVESYKAANISKALGGIIIPEKSFGTSFWAKCKTLERSFYLGVDWIEGARFFSKEVYDSLGGFDETLISGEDWDLSQKVEEKYKIERIKSYILHNEGDLKLTGNLKKKYYYAKEIGKYSSKKTNNKNFSKQSSPVARYKLFLSNPKKLFKNPIIGFGMLFMKASEFGAGLVGYFKK